MGDCQCTEGVKDGGLEDEEEMFSVRHSVLLRWHGRLNSCPLSWTHLFDTGMWKGRKTSWRKGRKGEIFKAYTSGAKWGPRSKARRSRGLFYLTFFIFEIFCTIHISINSYINIFSIVLWIFYDIGRFHWTSLIQTSKTSWPTYCI